MAERARECSRSIQQTKLCRAVRYRAWQSWRKFWAARGQRNWQTQDWQGQDRQSRESQFSPKSERLRARFCSKAERPNLFASPVWRHANGKDIRLLSVHFAQSPRRARNDSKSRTTIGSWRERSRIAPKSVSRSRLLYSPNRGERSTVFFGIIDRPRLFTFAGVHINLVERELEIAARARKWHSCTGKVDLAFGARIAGVALFHCANGYRARLCLRRGSTIDSRWNLFHCRA